MNDQEFVCKLLEAGVILGPDHFVLGDGHSNPDRHAGLFVVEERLEQEPELQRILIKRLWEQIADLSFDLVVSVNPLSFPVAQWLADLASEYQGKQIFACRCDSEPPPGNPTRALIHDSVINRGREASKLIAMMGEHGIRPVAISSLFTRVGSETLWGLPLCTAFARLLPTYDAADCPLCESGHPVNQAYGLGQAFLAQVATGHVADGDGGASETRKSRLKTEG